MENEITNELGHCAVVVPHERLALDAFPQGWGIRIEVRSACDLGSNKAAALLTKLKESYGFVLLVCESEWKFAEPVFEQVQKSKDLQVPHLEYIRVPTCAIYVPAGEPARQSKTLLIAEEVFKDCLTEFAREVDKEVVKHNGNYRLPSWINNYLALRNDSQGFNEILEDRFLDSVYIHDWQPDSQATQILIICNHDVHNATTYHCRFGPAEDIPTANDPKRNLFVKKLGQEILAGDLVRAEN